LDVRGRKRRKDNDGKTLCNEFLVDCSLMGSTLKAVRPSGTIVKPRLHDASWLSQVKCRGCALRRFMEVVKWKSQLTSKLNLPEFP
jgi:hypothetical protein